MYAMEDVLLLAVCMSMPLATWLVTKAMEASLITTLSLDSALNVSTTPSYKTSSRGTGVGIGYYRVLAGGTIQRRCILD